MELIIYLIGFFIMYYGTRYVQKHNSFNKQRAWEDVFIALFFSLFSWFAIISIILGISLICAFSLIYKLIKKINIKEPPKWL